MDFTIYMDWECVRIDPNISRVINERALPIERYGTEGEPKGDRDLK